jgi:glycosyltransferase involved in cell wall biosynthesis
MYAPVSEYLVGRLGESFTVYDCTDAWAKFDDVPDYVVRREDRLTREADVVFAGTGMLYEEKRRLNDRTHLMTCGVDFEHFNAGGEAGCPAVLRGIPRPVIGYAGLIDRERLDIGLLGAIAEAHPEWSVALVGPVQDRECLVLRSHRNIHFTGLVSYSDLPAYVREFDVAMVPYVVKEGTEYINPTKLLEYMAAGKPVVSSRIPEIVSAYDGRVVLAGSPGEFISGIEGLLSGKLKAPTDENREYASGFSWDEVQERMARLAGVCA